MNFLSLTPRDLLQIETRAKEIWLALPAESCLNGTNRPLTSHERTAICWFQASIELLHRLELIQNVDILLHTPDFQPDTDEGV